MSTTTTHATASTSPAPATGKARVLFPPRPRTIHVATTGSDLADGSEQAPLRTVNAAAQAAMPGDTVLIHAGTYREWVDPARGGLDETRRITYAAAPGERVVLKGSEVLTDWTQTEPGLWATTVPNSLFGDFNPYRETVHGDWVVRPTGDEPAQHLGEVYLDGVALREACDRAELRQPPAMPQIIDDWTGVTVAPAGGPVGGTWLADVTDETTTITVNLGGAAPADHLLEANVRRSVLYPRRHQVDYITVRGLEIAHAATPWAPPTGDQPGAIGPNWSKGWIIEDCDIHDAKCSAVSLGKEASTGDNYATSRHDRPGYQYQLESVFAGLEMGWSKEKVGSHVVRRNRIHHCGQNAVVGHLGCAFSVVEDNEIYAISTRRAFYGHEIAGIKLHAALDTQIRRNHIHNCSLGIWLDWETQGTRVSRNVLHDNYRDLFVEVSHGPYLVDHNVLASPASVEVVSQGGAYVGNLVLGTVRVETVPDRSTPYHLAHTTKVAGCSVVFGGDDRWIANLFGPGTDRLAYVTPRSEYSRHDHGTAAYDDCPSTWEEYYTRVATGSGDHRRFTGVKQAVTIRDNAYLAGAPAYHGETGASHLTGKVSVETEASGDVVLAADLPDGLAASARGPVTAAELGAVRMVCLPFTDPEGRPVDLTTDLLGQRRGDDGVAGPVSTLTSGRVRVWDAAAGRLDAADLRGGCACGSCDRQAGE